MDGDSKQRDPNSRDIVRHANSELSPTAERQECYSGDGDDDQSVEMSVDDSNSVKSHSEPDYDNRKDDVYKHSDKEDASKQKDNDSYHKHGKDRHSFKDDTRGDRYRKSTVSERLTDYDGDDRNNDDCHEITTVKVDNVSSYATIEQITTLFSFLGTVEQVEFVRCQEKLGPKSAFVRFSHAYSADIALHLSDTMFLDEPLTVVSCDAETERDFIRNARLDQSPEVSRLYSRSSNLRARGSKSPTRRGGSRRRRRRRSRSPRPARHRNRQRSDSRSRSGSWSRSRSRSRSPLSDESPLRRRRTSDSRRSRSPRDRPPPAGGRRRRNSRRNRNSHAERRRRSPRPSKSRRRRR